MAEERGSKKDLLSLETDSSSNTSSNSCSSKLFLCANNGGFSRPQTPLEKPPMFPVPKSQVLGKVKDFLTVFEESNKKLLQDAQDNREKYDIEVLSGKESDYIEMDLMLGVADLHTPEAVAAAEAAIAGNQPRISLEESSSDSEDEDNIDEEDNGNEKDDTRAGHDDEAGRQSTKFGSKDADVNSSCKSSKKQKSQKRPNIVELS